MNESKIYHKRLVESLEHLISLDISQILLFGIPKERNQNGDFSSAKRGIIQNSIRKIRENFGNNFSIFSDVCLCQYNTSGHCGILSNENGNIDMKRKKPPNKVRIKKEGRHWVEDGVLQDLFDDIGLAIEEYRWKTGLRILKLETPDKRTTQFAPLLPNHYISV